MNLIPLLDDRYAANPGTGHAGAVHYSAGAAAGFHGHLSIARGGADARRDP